MNKCKCLFLQTKAFKTEAVEAANFMKHNNWSLPILLPTAIYSRLAKRAILDELFLP